MAFKTFTDGSALGASELNTYLMAQVNIVCTSSTRPSAPIEGMKIYETDTDREYIYNGVWVRLPSASSSTGRTGVRILRNANQTITNNNATAVSWDTEGFDSDGFINVTSDTVVVPAGCAGLYVMNAEVQWVSDPRTGGNTFIEISAAGKTFRNASASSYAIFNNVSTLWALAVSDQVQVNVLQQTAGSLVLTQAILTMHRVSA